MSTQWAAGPSDLLMRATAVTLVGGTIIGLVAGYLGGRWDSVLMRLVDLVFAFPFLVLIIAIIAMLGPSIFNMFIAIWITSWVAYARIMRAQTVVAKRQQYVLAARALGYGRLRMMLRHMLPNTASAVIIFSDAGALLGEFQRGPLGFGEDVRLPPRRDQMQPQLAFAGVLGVLGVHVGA